VSTVYESLSLERISKIIPFYTKIQLEQFLVEICKQQSVKARIDHKNQCVYFGPEESSLTSDLENEEGNSAEVRYFASGHFLTVNI
jgi:hypothetical protein